MIAGFRSAKDCLKISLDSAESITKTKYRSFEERKATLARTLMTPQEFIAKWQRAKNLSERSACQQHFLDLCRLLNQAPPAEVDPDGDFYTFEKGVQKSEGGKGWADVWKRDHFGWEYKGLHRDLKAAYKQLLLYREDLGNPPLLVVCDLDRFEIHTNFTGTAKTVHQFSLDGLADPQNLEILRKLFTHPAALKPEVTTAKITQEAAERFARIIDGMYRRDIAPGDAAHFVMKLMFCMFGEDIQLLPERVFAKTLDNCQRDPKRLSKLLTDLFAAMASGGDFGPIAIPYFNGGLFADSTVYALTPLEIDELILINKLDWSSVEPSIFGTLFERSLDPSKRSQIGAHYTSSADMLTLLEPVMMTPLRREWAAIHAECEVLWPKIIAQSRKQPTKKALPKKTASKERKQFDKLVRGFVEDLSHIRVLDPACGSGNFLYTAINLLLNLEKEVITYAADHGLSLIPSVRPTQLAGIEINPYAQELAQVVIWIGYLQWMHHNGFNAPRDPILEPIETIQRMDAILDLSDPDHPKEPEWPEADFIVGNPPFLGGSKLWEELGRDYQQKLWATYEHRVPGVADLCCYWFEKARAQIKLKKADRVGLLATQAIRGGANRVVLKSIKETGDIFFAISDMNWILDGASVHISMAGFDDGQEKHRLLDGKIVSVINSNLTANANIVSAIQLASNLDLVYIGTKKAGDFNIDESTAFKFHFQPNPHGKPNSDLLVPWLNGGSIVKRLPQQWIIDPGEYTTLENFSLYQELHAHVLANVKPKRDENKEERTRTNWWLYKRNATDMRNAISKHLHYIATPRVSKHRIFVWLSSEIMCDDGIYVFARSDDYFFGILHSRLHEIWSLAQGTQVREKESGFRYTPTTCFETFPFPDPTPAQRAAIAAAARELDTLRNNWLNPPEWTKTETLEFPGSVAGPWRRYLHEANGAGIGTVRYPRIVAKDADHAAKLAKRTLTNLYNERPTWLDLAHRKLDEAVFAAYGWPSDLSDDDLLAKLLELNLQQA